jgi:hypothetical protein
MACVQLADDLRCKLWDSALRPAVCGAFPADVEHCGRDRAEALAILTRWEQLTA